MSSNDRPGDILRCPGSLTEDTDTLAVPELLLLAITDGEPVAVVVAGSVPLELTLPVLDGLFEGVAVDESEDEAVADAVCDKEGLREGDAVAEVLTLTDGVDAALKLIAGVLDALAVPVADPAREALGEPLADGETVADAD